MICGLTDSESRLFYNWNRYYNPTTGRYISSDPIGLGGGLNTYAYAGANPVMYVDPRGLIKWTGTAINSAVSAGLIGTTNIRFSLVSECVNGRKAKVTVYASASGFSFGFSLTYLVGQSYTFEDGREPSSGVFSYNPDDGSGLDTSVFNGDFAIASGGVFAGISGVGIESIQLGEAFYSSSGASWGAGFAAGFLYAEGTSKVVGSPQYEECVCN